MHKNHIFQLKVFETDTLDGMFSQLLINHKQSIRNNLMQEYGADWRKHYTSEVSEELINSFKQQAIETYSSIKNQD